jgi:signal transduction histidine kinase
MFQPFFRGAEAANVSGMGLGLTVSQRLVQRMRGDLHVETPTTGAALALILPADRRTFALVERLDWVRNELHTLLSQGALSVALLRRRSGLEADSQRLELALRDSLHGDSARVASLSETSAVIWTRAGVRPLVQALSSAIQRLMGPQADLDFEVAVRRASAATHSDALLLQTAVRCRHSLAAIARRREVWHVENSRRGR